jgi:hypothetical protein
MDQEPFNFGSKAMENRLAIIFSRLPHSPCFFSYGVWCNETRPYGVLYCWNIVENPNPFNFIPLPMSLVPEHLAESLSRWDCHDHASTVFQFFSPGHIWCHSSHRIFPSPKWGDGYRMESERKRKHWEAAKDLIRIWNDISPHATEEARELPDEQIFESCHSSLLIPRETCPFWYRSRR